MKKRILFIFLLPIILCVEENSYTGTITFSSSDIQSTGDGVTISGTTATITSSGSYLVKGTSTEGTVKIKVSSVNLYLEDLDLSSSTTGPIIVNSNLNDIKIIAIKNVVLNDLEDQTTTTGECAAIKIKKYTKATIKNQNDFKLIGKCKNVIKGGVNATIIFENSDGEYTIDAYQNGIASDGLLTFNGGIFTITTETGDGIKSSPDDGDTESLGKIVVNGGTFNIQSNTDGFQAKNNIVIKKGTFDIKTEKGYNSGSFNKDTSSAKGFKVSNNETGCEIRVYNGEFTLNTADDAFHSNGNLTLIDGNYKIYSGDDGLHAEFHLLIGKSDSSTTPTINILSSYEAIEGMSIRIYSGKINVTASDDGINSAGGSSSGGEQPRPGPHLKEGPPSGGGDSSDFISIYGGEIYVYCNGDGLDSNGNIYIHGGDINIFSQGNNGDNEPIDHDGDFTLFNAIVLGAGSKGMEYVHSGIDKGNQKYAYYTKSVNSNTVLKIIDGNGNIEKQVTITKTVSYIFYSSPKLDNSYKFYLNDKEYSFTTGTPTSGTDDQDTKTDDGGMNKDDDDQSGGDDDQSGGNGQTDDNNTSNNNSSSKTTVLIVCICIIVPILIIIIVFFILIKMRKQKNEQLLSKDNINKELDSKELSA